MNFASGSVHAITDFSGGWDRAMPVMWQTGIMASKKMTDKLAEQERQLIRACEILNADPEVRKIEKEFDALTDEIAEPWEDSPAS